MELCKKCPGKLHLTMKPDTGVKKAIAVRLLVLLRYELDSYQLDTQNYYLMQTLTQTQKMRVIRHYRKRIAALKVVIEMCNPKKNPLPEWYYTEDVTEFPEVEKLKRFK